MLWISNNLVMDVKVTNLLSIRYACLNDLHLQHSTAWVCLFLAELKEEKIEHEVCYVFATRVVYIVWWCIWFAVVARRDGYIASSCWACWSNDMTGGTSFVSHVSQYTHIETCCVFFLLVCAFTVARTWSKQTIMFRPSVIELFHHYYTVRLFICLSIYPYIYPYIVYRSIYLCIYRFSSNSFIWLDGKRKQTCSPLHW